MKIKIFFTAIVLSLGIPLGVSAEITKGVANFDYNNGCINVVGCVTEADFEEKVILQLIHGEKINELLSNIEDVDFENTYADIRIIEPSVTGEFSDKIGVDEMASGEYVLRIKASSFDTLIDNTVYVISKADIEKIKQIIDNKGDIVKEILEDTDLSKAVMAGDSEIISLKNKTLTEKLIKSERALLDTDAVTYVQKVAKAAITDYINEIESVQQLDYLEKENYLPASKTFERYAQGSDFRSSVAAKIDAQTYSSYEEFENKFSEAVMLAAVRYPVGRNDILTIITENNISVNMSGYNVLAEEKKISVLQKVAYIDYQTESDFIAAFNQAVKDATDTNSVGGVPGTSGQGSSTAGGSSITIGSTAVTTPQTFSQDTGFADADDALWAKDKLNELKKQGIINGYEDNTFRPNNFITREEFVTMAVLAFGLSGKAQINFDDVKPENWYYKYVACAVANEMTKGISAKSFGAGTFISRQDAVTMMYRMTDGFKTAEITFADKENISPYAIDAVGAMADAGIISGRGDNEFAPTMNLTRAEAAVIIYNLLKY